MGQLGPSELPRVRELAVDSKVQALAKLQVVSGNLGEKRLQGTVDGQVGLRCQRCLEVWSWPFHLALDLILLPPEASDSGTSEFCEVAEEGWELDCDGLLHPALVVEEEILLALPMVPRHPDCAAGWRQEFAQDAAQSARPFADLATLLGKSKGEAGS